MIPTFRPWTHTSDDSYIYQLSLVVATATVSSTTHVSRGEPWATEELARDLSNACKLRHSKRSKKGLHFIDLTMIGIRRSAFNPIIDKLPDHVDLLFSHNSIFCPVSVLGDIYIFHVAWGLLIMRCS